MLVQAVIPLYPPGSMVGSWVSTHACLRHLAQRGHEVRVGITHSRVKPYTLDGVKVASLRDPGTLNEALAEADLLITHAGDNGQAGQIAAAIGLTHVRFVHGLKSNPASADLVVFNAEATRLAMDWDRPSIVVHPPVDPERHRVEETGGCITIVNCTKQKGIVTAWKAAELLPHRRFLGVRGGYGHQVIPRLPNFRVVGPLSDMRTAWRDTRILLMPSDFETWGRVGVEAMISGIPVIAHPTPGLRESLGDAGIFRDRDDYGGWADTIEALMTDEVAWQEESAGARSRSDELDPGSDLDRFADTIEELVSA